MGGRRGRRGRRHDRFGCRRGRPARGRSGPLAALRTRRPLRRDRRPRRGRIVAGRALAHLRHGLRLGRSTAAARLGRRGRVVTHIGGHLRCRSTRTVHRTGRVTATRAGPGRSRMSPRRPRRGRLRGTTIAGTAGTSRPAGIGERHRRHRDHRGAHTQRHRERTDPTDISRVRGAHDVRRTWRRPGTQLDRTNLADPPGPAMPPRTARLGTGGQGRICGHRRILHDHARGRLPPP